MVETQRDDAEGPAGSSRITSSVRRVRILFKCRAKGINVRTLIRGRVGPAALDEFPGGTRSVAAI
jgi:hypothetical protein